MSEQRNKKFDVKFKIGDIYCVDPKTGEFVPKAEFEKLYPVKEKGEYKVTNVTTEYVEIKKETK